MPWRVPVHFLTHGFVVAFFEGVAGVEQPLYLFDDIFGTHVVFLALTSFFTSASMAMSASRRSDTSGWCFCMAATTASHDSRRRL